MIQPDAGNNQGLAVQPRPATGNAYVVIGTRASTGPFLVSYGAHLQVAAVLVLAVNLEMETY